MPARPAGRPPRWRWFSRCGWCWPGCGVRRRSSNALLGVFYVLLWVGLVALSLLFGPVWRVISPMRTVYLLLRRLMPGAPRLHLSRKLGVSPRRGGPVRLRVDGTGQPGFGVAAVGQGVAADLCRGDAGRGVAVRAALVGPRRPVRRVQHGGVAALPVSPQSGHRENRHRQPVRPPAVVARAAGCRRDAGGAARIDGVRQFLVVADVARLCRSDHARLWHAADAVVVGAANPWADCLHFGCGSDVFRWRPARRAASTAINVVRCRARWRTR